MTILSWQLSSDIENSLIEFLRTEISNQSLQLLDSNGIAKTLNVYAGRTFNALWQLPMIQIYLDSKPDSGRLEIGSNIRLRSFQFIFDIRTQLPGQESNIADWVESTINDGINVYNYMPNVVMPEIPIKSYLGHARIDFITSLPVPPFDNAEPFDQNRYRITCKIWLNQKSCQ